jgi:hypothetical protein
MMACCLQVATVDHSGKGAFRDIAQTEQETDGILAGISLLSRGHIRILPRCPSLPYPRNELLGCYRDMK